MRLAMAPVLPSVRVVMIVDGVVGEKKVRLVTVVVIKGVDLLGLPHRFVGTNP